MSIRDRIASLLRATQVMKDTPTGSSVHVPAPLGESDDEKKKRRARAAAALGYKRMDDDDTLTLAKRIAKAENSAQYIGRLVMNADQLRVWWELQAMTGAVVPLDPNPHITVAYSREAFDWTIDRSWVIVMPEEFDGIGLLGPKNAVVLFLKSPLLQSRWQGTKDAGATWDHDGYRPHVTLCYLGADYAGDFDGADAPIPAFPIVLGPELMGTGGVDVFEAVKAPEWYQTAMGVTKSADEKHVHVTVNVAPPAVTVPISQTFEAAPARANKAVIRDPASGQSKTVEFTNSEG